MTTTFMRTTMLHIVVVTCLFGAGPTAAKPSKKASRSRVVVDNLIRTAVVDSGRIAANETQHLEVDVTRVSASARCNVESVSVASGGERSTWTFRLTGTSTRSKPCQGWAWAKVTPMRNVWIATSSLSPGDSLSAHFRSELRAKTNGDVVATLVPEGGIARARLAKGQVLKARDIVAAGPTMGSSIDVRLRAGSIVVAGQGTRVPCGSHSNRGQVCARTKSGAKVAGTFSRGSLWVTR